MSVGKFDTLRHVAVQFVCAFGAAAVVLTYVFTLLPEHLLQHSGPRVVLVLAFAYGIGCAWAFVYYVWTLMRR